MFQQLWHVRIRLVLDRDNIRTSSGPGPGQDNIPSIPMSIIPLVEAVPCISYGKYILPAFVQHELS